MLPETEAKVDVIEGNLEVRFVKTSDLEVGAAPNEQASRGHGGKFLDENGAREIAVIGPRQTLVRVRGNSATPENDPGMDRVPVSCAPWNGWGRSRITPTWRLSFPTSMC